MSRAEDHEVARVPNSPARILFVRGLHVILDEDLAQLYGVETRTLVQAVKRNAGRFPPDFVIQLTAREMKVVERQTTTANGHGGRRTRAYGFTEHGVAMLSSVLRSDQAIRVNIEIMRSFVRLRRRVGEIAELAARLEELEQRYDARFKQVFDAIRALMAPKPGDRRPIGF